jgi:hypothetical protein
MSLYARSAHATCGETERHRLTYLIIIVYYSLFIHLFIFITIINFRASQPRRDLRDVFTLRSSFTRTTTPLLSPRMYKRSVLVSRTCRAEEGRDIYPFSFFLFSLAPISLALA